MVFDYGLSSGFVDWTLIISLVFGGCCSNAWTLEVATSKNPRAGTLITFAQFVFVALTGIPKRLVFRLQSPATDNQIDTPFEFTTLLRHPTLLRTIRLKPLAIPLSQWIIQVVLFLLTSLLNNAAFAYKVPMAVHIIFRSAGLVTNLILGRLIVGKRYTRTQVASVIIVSLGVLLTTISPAQKRSTSPPNATTNTASSSSTFDPKEYLTGIAILTLALVLSSLMGLAQDATYTKYGRGHWEEGMFLLHTLSLPMFGFMASDIQAQVRHINSDTSNKFRLAESLPKGLGVDAPLFSPFVVLPGMFNRILSTLLSTPIPLFYIPLALNILTQFVCVSGVHRLTAKVSSLTVTLVLTIRKAVSLIISVVILGGGRGEWKLWSGAGLVLIGSVLYTVGAGMKSDEKTKEKKKAE